MGGEFVPSHDVEGAREIQQKDETVSTVLSEVVAQGNGCAIQELDLPTIKDNYLGDFTSENSLGK